MEVSGQDIEKRTAKLLIFGGKFSEPFDELSC